MLLESPEQQTVRTRQRVLVACAAVILIFAGADILALGHLSALMLGLRMGWAASMLGAAVALPRVRGPGLEWMMGALAVTSCLFFSALVELTGGPTSPFFQWILVMPILISLLVQDQSRAVWASAVTTVGCGAFILLRGGEGAARIVPWCVLASAMSALAVYAASSYRTLYRARDELFEQRAQSAERNARLAAERLLREQAEAQVRARDEFLGIASHELRTPMASMRLCIDAVAVVGSSSRLEGNALKEALRPRLWALERQARRLESLVARMLDVTRITSGKLQLDLRPVDLAEVVREVVRAELEEARRLGCEVIVDADGQVEGIGDRVHLEQVVHALVSNALCYGRGRPIRIGVRAGDGAAELSVSDQGIGIAPEDQARIFERFERAVSSRHYGGLGLGLWITQQIVAAHGGQVQVSSQLGKGSTFVVRLPSAAGESFASSQRSGA